MKRLLIVLILFFSYTTYSQTAEKYFERGLEKAQNGDYYGALSEFNKGIKLDPNDAMAYFNRALVKNFLKNYYGAINDYTKSIQLNPNNSISYTGRGTTKKDLKQYSKAIADFNIAIKLKPDNSEAFLNRGVSKYGLKDYSGANADYSKVIDLNNNRNHSALAYVNRAALHQARFLQTKDDTDLMAACIDMRMATVLGNSSAEKWVVKYCN